MRALLLEHLQELYAFYGEESGVRIARKHIAWYTKAAGRARPRFEQPSTGIEDAQAQLAAVDRFFARLARMNERLIYGEGELAA